MVLFYNTGDIYAAYQSGRAGVVQNLDQIAAKFETGAKQATLLDRLQKTSSYSLFEHLIDRSRIANSEQKNEAPKQLVTYNNMGIDDREGLMWIDAGHATPVGNKVIAQKILRIIQRQLRDQ